MTFSSQFKPFKSFVFAIRLRSHGSKAGVLPQDFGRLNGSIMWGTSMLNLEHDVDHHYDTDDLGVKDPHENRRIRLIAYISFPTAN
jgi:hypothetical protein